MRYFLSRYNRFYSFAIHRKLVVLYAITAAILLVVVAVWFCGCYMTLSQKIAVMRHTIDNNTHLCTTLCKTRKQCQQLTKDIRALKKDLHGKVGPVVDHSNILVHLADAAECSGCVLRVCSLEKGAMHHVDALEADCVLSATFDQLIAFFDRLAAQRIPVECTHLDMQGGDEYDVRCNLRVHGINKSETKKSPSTLEKS